MNSRNAIIYVVLGMGGALGLGIWLGRGPLAASTEGSDSGPGSWAAGTSLSVLRMGGSASGVSGGSGGSVVGGDAERAAVADALLEVINNPNGQQAVNRFYQMLSTMPSQDIAKLIVDIDRYPNHSRRRETREMIIDYLAMADPRKALEVREELPDKGIFSKAMRQLGRNNPEEALRLRESLSNSTDRSDALTAIFVGASEVDPAGAFALLKKTAEAGPQHYHEVFDNWAEMDPVTAARMALTIEASAERREALKIVGQEWAERDPEAVLDWVSDTDLSAYERETIRNSALNAYARRDAKAAMALLETLDSTTRNRVLPNVVRELIEEDPSAASEWLRSAPEGFSKYRVINEVGYAFANEAPEMALDLAREIPELKERVLGNAFRSLASKDLETAMQLADEWRTDPEYRNIAVQIASSFSESDPEAALSWASGLEDEVKHAAMSSVIMNLARDEPLVAVDHLEKMGLAMDDPIYRNSLNNIVTTWAREDPVSAAEWLTTLPESWVRDSAVGDIADRWARIDPVSAWEWIGSLNAGPGRDQAAHRLVNRIQREDPEMAAAWASSIGEENMRNSALQNVFSQWSQMDPEGAAAAAAASGLPEPMKERFLPPSHGTAVPLESPFSSSGRVLDSPGGFSSEIIRR